MGASESAAGAGRYGQCRRTRRKAPSTSTAAMAFTVVLAVRGEPCSLPVHCVARPRVAAKRRDRPRPVAVTRGALETDQYERSDISGAEQEPNSFEFKSNGSGDSHVSSEAATRQKAATNARDTESAATEALELLEWPELSQRLSRLASTPVARSIFSKDGVPLADNVEHAQELLAQTRAAVRLEQRCGALDFSGAADISWAVGYAKRGGALSGRELVAVADTLRALRRVKRTIAQYGDADNAAHVGGALNEGDTMRALEALVDGVSTKAELEQDLRRCIDEEGRVLDSASDDLAQLRRQSRGVSAKVKDDLQQIMARRSDALQDKIITLRNDRMVLAVKASHKARIPGTVHDVSASGVTLYIEPKQVTSDNTTLRALSKREREIEERICAQLSGKIGEEGDDMMRLLDALTHVDMAAARARHDGAVGGVEPAFTDNLSSPRETEGYVLKLRAAAHPLLLWQQREGEHRTGDMFDGDGGEDSWSVVPSDFLMREGVSCAVITGPNTGGKTVALKTLGLAALMARAGMYVCAKEAVLPFFDNVLADIGDDQSIVQSLSTFSGHVRRVRRLLAEVTPKSIVLLDEVGSGTDPAEGSALGMALLRHLADAARVTLATTHHGEVKTLKYSDERGRFENASVEFDDVRMRPTFRLQWGIPGRSNALSIARRLGLKTSVVDDAERLLKESDAADVNAVIAALEQQKQELERAARSARESEREAERLRAELNHRAEQLRADEARERSRVRDELQVELDSAREQVRSTIRAMRQTGGDAKLAGEARSSLDAIESSQMASSQRKAGGGKGGEEEVDEEPVENLQAGDSVHVAHLGSTSVKVAEPPNARGELTVLMGGLKVKVKLQEVSRSGSGRGRADAGGPSAGVNGSGSRGGSGGPSAGGSRPSPMPQRRGQGASGSGVGKMSRTSVKTTANTVDVRGERVEEALDRVREALMSSGGFDALWVIHGHGSGALRNAVRSMLQRNKQVQSFEDADRLDGGAGATVVRLL